MGTSRAPEAVLMPAPVTPNDPLPGLRGRVGTSMVPVRKREIREQDVCSSFSPPKHPSSDEKFKEEGTGESI